MTDDPTKALMIEVSLHLAEHGYAWDDLSANCHALINMSVIIATMEKGALPGVYVAMTSRYFFMKHCLYLAKSSNADPIPVWRAIRKHETRWVAA